MASRKLQALAFIEIYYARHGVGPSTREISAALNCSTGRAIDAVKKLHREGRIARTPGVPRSIRPISAEEEAMRRLASAGYVVTKAGLPGVPVLDHIPTPHGQEKIESTAAGAARHHRRGPQAENSAPASG